VNVRDSISGSEHSEPGRPGVNDEPGNPEGDGPPYSGASSGKRQRKIVLLGASVAAAAVFTAIGFGAVSVIRDQVTSAAASDPARGLTLLQIQGGSAFRPVAIGNSRDLGAGAAVTSIAARADGRAFTLGVGNVTSDNTVAAVGGRRLTGLMSITARVMPGGIGGPLVNLSGQVIGLDVAGSARGVNVTGYAIPIKSALAVARQLNATQR
jgi:S1-C subfamily serine protease